MVQTAIRVTAEQLERLRALSDRTGAPMAWHVRRALESYLKRAEGEAATLAPDRAQVSKLGQW
jgi:predicted DNA-binding protein